MRNPLGPPVSPGADTVPPVWAGRTAQLSGWRDALRPRRLAGIHDRGRTVLGEAGLGKSSLVRRIAGDASRRGDWVTPQLRIRSEERRVGKESRAQWATNQGRKRTNRVLAVTSTD